MKKVTFVAVAAFAAATFFTIGGDRASAATCTSLSSDKGLATLTKNEDTSLADLTNGQYNVWSRVKSDDGMPAYKISIYGDGGELCDQSVSDTNGNNAGSWEWIKLGTKLQWSGGEVTIQMAGDKDGTGLDCVVLHQNDSFSPSSKEDCNPLSNDNTQPSVPAGFSAAANSAGDAVDLSWNASNDDNGVKEYRVYRRDDNGSWPSSPITTTAETTHTDSGVSAGSTYVYRIVAVDYAGNESPASSEKTVSIAAPVGCDSEDVNDDGLVTAFDMGLIVKNFSARNNNAAPAVYNVDGDGLVDILDYLTVYQKLGYTGCN